MGKKYKHAETDPKERMVREPALEYGIQEEIIGSPPLTEEELRDSMTGEEFLDAVLSHIDKLFDKK